MIASGTPPRSGDPVERGVLVESAHVDDPFDDLAVSPDRERPAPSRNRRRREINLRRRGAVDGDLGLASLAALVEGRQVHERELDRPLGLVSVGASEKYDRVGGVYATHRLGKPVRAGIGEKAENRLLRLIGIVRMARSHGSG